MSTSRQAATAAILEELRRGDRTAPDRLLPLVYDELRGLARHLLRQERPEHTLQPTALVHEAYLRLVDQRSSDPKDHAHFIAIACTVMRRILVDHARRRAADKRGGDAARVMLSEELLAAEPCEVGILEIDRALSRLEELDGRRAEVTKLRVFGGLSHDEIAELLGLSRRTVEREWHAGRAWLSVEMRGE